MITPKTGVLRALLFLSSSSFISAHPSQISNKPCSCSSLQAPFLPGTLILSFSTQETTNLTVSDPTSLLLPSPVAVPPVCNVTITLTHPDVNDTVTVQVWLPLSNWNSRFVALGGSGWAAGHGPLTLGPAVANGFAAASTDAGVGSNPQDPSTWALTETGDVNLGLLTNFASRSVYEMAALGKAVTQSFYGTKPTSYWNGCSTGGRQGLVAAQQYPEVFDGILVGAPAIYWPTYVMAELWPQVVMKEAGAFPSQQELNAVVEAAVEACDETDGVKDGVITEPEKCGFDPASAVGKKNFEGQEIEITSTTAEIVKKIWEGPVIDGQKLWYGLPIGSPLDTLANTTMEQGARQGFPFFVPETWAKFFLKKDSDFQTSTIVSKQLKDLFFESQIQYDGLFNNANPDLSSLQRSGGKLLVWHGAADQIIFPQGTTQYRKQVEDVMGGAAQVDEFFRYFLAPGVDHCGLGQTFGAKPNNSPFEALIAWVENSIAPTEIVGETPPNAPLNFTRKICSYPLVPRYSGQGDVNSAKSFECA